MLTPSIGFCGTPLSTDGRLHAGGFEDRRHDVDDVVELRADAALVLDPLRPGDDQAVARAAEVRGDLLGPLERRVHRVRPADRVVVVTSSAPPSSSIMRQHVLEVLGRGVEDGHFVERALQAAFGAGAVVALDVDDQRVVQLARSPRWRRGRGRCGGRSAARAAA